MITETVDIRLSSKASNIAARFAEELHFKNAISAAKFAFAYKLRTTAEENIFGWYVLSEKKSDPRFDTTGNNYGGRVVDGDGRMTALLKMKFPSCEAPHQYIRLLMDAGLCELGDMISSKEDFLKFLNSQIPNK